MALPPTLYNGLTMIRFFSKSFTLTEALKAYAENKLVKLTEHIEMVKDPEVEFARETHHKSGDGVFRAEVMLHLPKALLRAEASNADMYAAFDETIPKLKEQLLKYKGHTHDKPWHTGQ